MKTDCNPQLLPAGRHVLDLVATVASVGKRVLLYCLPTAAVVFLYPGFGDEHYRALGVTLTALVVFLSAWSFAVRPPEEDTFEILLAAWFYNMTAFGATVFAVIYAASPVRYVFLMGFPLTAVEFTRHLRTGGDADA